MAGNQHDKPRSQYERVKQILDAAHEGSCSNYQGYGRFWNLPLAEFLQLSLYGVRMIAPPAVDYSKLTPRQVAEQGPVTHDTLETDAAEVASNGASDCGSNSKKTISGSNSGRGRRSGLIKGLRGEFPFDGSQFPPLMWGVDSRVATAQIAEIERWIDAGCAESDAPRVDVCQDQNLGRAIGDQTHPPYNGHVNQHRRELNMPRVRKNINTMTSEEFQLYQMAIAEMHRWDNYPLDVRSWTFWAQIHPNDCQHGWEEFLPWHRAYLYEMEKRMQDWDPNVALPYWSWTEYYQQNKALGTGKSPGQTDNGFIPLRYGCWVSQDAIDALQGNISAANLNALKRILWDSGNPEEQVFMSGTRLLKAAGINYPSQSEAAYRDINKIFEQLKITNPAWHCARWPGGGSGVYFANYPAPQDISEILKTNNFFQFGSGPANDHFFGQLESIHNLMHNFSGGTNPNYVASGTEPQTGDMTSGAVTAYDPIFWGHHSNVDRIWWEWQEQHPGVFADNPNTILSPWKYTVQDMRSIAPLDYEYSLATTHFPTYPNTFMTRFKSEKAGIHESVLGLHRRAEVRLHGVQYHSAPGLVRVYLNDANANEDTHPHKSDQFVGEFHIFQGQCVGGPGHCDPLPPRQAGDLRARDRKTPGNVRLDATNTVRSLLEKGETDFDVHLVVLDLDGKPAQNVLKLSSVSLNFSD